MQDSYAIVSAEIAILSTAARCIVDVTDIIVIFYWNLYAVLSDVMQYLVPGAKIAILSTSNSLHCRCSGRARITNFEGHSL